jgi:hypothetical protein
MIGSGGRDLVEFSFESAPAAELPAAVFLRLARQASAFNIRMGLTGRLRLQGGRFVQTIEGQCDVVLALAARILADHRHQAIRTIAFHAIAVRRFADWGVSGFAPDAAEIAGAENLRLMPALAERRRMAIPASIHGLGAGIV